MEKYLIFMDCTLYIIKRLIPPKLIYRFSTVRAPSGFFWEEISGGKNLNENAENLG